MSPDGESSSPAVVIHNFGICAAARTRIRDDLRPFFDQAATSPAQRQVFVLGDFNLPSTPPVEMIHREGEGLPVDSGAMLVELGADSRRWGPWSLILAPLVLLDRRGHARYDMGAQQLSHLDEVFRGCPDWFTKQLFARVVSATDPMETAARGLGDHAPLVVEVRLRSEIVGDSRPTPRSVF